MRATSFRHFLAALGFAAALLLFFGQSNCANSDQPVDISEAGADDADAGPGCGALGGPCCPPSQFCHVGAFCNQGICKPQHTTDIGKACSVNSDCQSGLCGYVQFPDISMVDAGEGGTTEFPDGGGPPSSSVCTTGCTSDTQCEPGWLCKELAVGIGICTCTANPEVCDGKDNNCNGIIDDEPYVDQDCTANVGMGIPEVCKNAKCNCVNTCSGMCVDINNDSTNCGKCGVMCDPNVQVCKKGSCVCGNMAGTVQMCGSQCVDTATDHNNCGGCGKPCPFTCSMGQCGPTAIPATSVYGKSFVLDATNVYWLDSSTYPYTIKYCAISGCMTPTLLATMAMTPSYGSGQAIAVANNTVFWGDTNNGFVQSCPVAGCTAPKTLAQGQSPSAMVADSTNVYWTNTSGPPYNVMKCAAASCTPSVVTPSTSSFNYYTPGLALDGSRLVWYSYGDSKIESCPITGCGNVPIVIQASVSLDDLTAGGGQAMWTTYPTQVSACGDSAACSSPTILSTIETYPYGVATDGTTAYWAEDDPKTSGGGLKKCALAGCGGSPGLYISNQDYPQYVAVGPNAVAWNTQGKLLVFSK